MQETNARNAAAKRILPMKMILADTSKDNWLSELLGVRCDLGKGRVEVEVEGMVLVIDDGLSISSGGWVVLCDWRSERGERCKLVSINFTGPKDKTGHAMHDGSKEICPWG